MLYGINGSQENGDMIRFADPVTGSDVFIYIVPWRSYIKLKVGPFSTYYE
jgi:hypothetical protein